MTLEEKIALLSGKDFWHTCENSEMKSIMVSDGPHGLRKQDEGGDCKGVNESITSVCFPSASCLASSFDTEIMKKLGNTLGEECAAEDVSVLLGPAVNIKRSPLCGRNFEYFSEDPYLTGKMAESYINAVQEKGVGTSIKHFAVNNQEKRRMSISAEVDERALREIYFKGFEIAVKGSQPKTIMCSYNKINGVYASENKWLLTDILRNEWGFKGFVMSDWGAVHERYKGVKAGLDLEMPGSYGIGANNIKKALGEGKITEEEIDKSVAAIKGVVDSINPAPATFDKAKDHKISKEIALNSMVLLKNEDNALPLNENEKVAFIGEFAEKPRFQGGGSSHIKAFKVLSATEICPNIPYAKGFCSTKDDSDFEEEEKALALAKEVDKVVVFAGIPDSYESEAFDRKTMSLPPNQDRLIKRLSLVNENIIVVLHNGSPVEMPWINDVKSVFEAYLGGEASHEALVDLLFGKSNPCGKLAETFPMSITHNPSYYNFPGNHNTVEYRESIFVGYRHFDNQNLPVLFPFGHGLSYTTFEYSDIKLDGLKLTFNIKNTGKVAGKEIAEVYISNLNSKVFRAEKELKAFTKVSLNAGEEKKVSITLSSDDFTYYNIRENKWVTEKGTYKILVGASSRDIKLEAETKLDGIDTIPYDEEINSVYKNEDKRFINQSDFEKFLGRKIEIDIPKYPYSADCCLGDITETLAGKIANKGVDIFCGGDTELGSGDINKAFALESPVRNFATMSLGGMSKEMNDSVLNILNDRKIVSSLGALAVNSIKNAVKLIKENNK